MRDRTPSKIHVVHVINRDTHNDIVELPYGGSDVLSPGGVLKVTVLDEQGRRAEVRKYAHCQTSRRVWRYDDESR